MNVTVVVERHYWRTVKDKPGVQRIRHSAVITFEGGPTLRTTRISDNEASALVAAGAQLRHPNGKIARGKIGP